MTHAWVLGKRALREGIRTPEAIVPTLFFVSVLPFPTHMLATSPQKRSGCVAIMFGPGWMPFTMNAAIMRAITAFSGMPMLISGMKLVRAAASSAAAWPATPSMAPWPISCLYLLNLRSIA